MTNATNVLSILAIRRYAKNGKNVVTINAFRTKDLRKNAQGRLVV
jgi:hypothetical protein